MAIREAGPADLERLLDLRHALWPDDTRERLADETRRLLAMDDYAFLLADTGLAEVAVRRDAPGCDTAPVGYLEAWYVEPGARRTGVGRALVRAAEAWARAHGCAEMASDCHLDNAVSRAAHAALGYREHSVCVHFAKRL